MLKYFTKYEIFPPEISSLPDDQLWGLMDTKLLAVLERLREDIGKPFTVNNYTSKEVVKYYNRGYRSKYCKVGAEKSMHKVGKAIDFTVEGMEPEKVRKYIIANHAKYPEIRRMETGVSWVHIDTKDTGTSEIVLFKP